MIIIKSFYHLISFPTFTHRNMIKAEKIFQDPEIGAVTFRRNAGGSRMSIRVHPLKGVSVSVPYMIPYSAAMLFFQARREWVLETIAKQKEKFKDVHVPSEDEIEALRRKAKKELPPRMLILANRYDFLYNRVTIKHNATNWGSCSAKGNINLNLNIVRLPRVLQDYVLLHELCHLRHHDHGHAFHLLLEHVLTDNLMRLMGEDGLDKGSDDYKTIMEIARKAAASKAKYPLDYTMTRAIKSYPLV